MKKLSHLAALFLSCSFPCAAHAACLPPMANGVWQILQSNGYYVDLVSSVSGPHQFNGKAKVLDAYHPQRDHSNIAGSWFSQNGTMTIAWKVYWINGSIGAYSGTIDGNGFLRGSTHDESHPGNSAGFHSLTPMVSGGSTC